MAEKLTASRLNRLGKRLRKGHATDDDIRALTQFRESFRPAFNQVARALESLGPLVAGRPAKTTGSNVGKLSREKTRLSTMQDIAGCRVEVANRIEQNNVVNQIVQLFPNSRVDDRRTRPSHHYRAMHVIVSVEGRSVEVQIRTPLQNRWAQMVEALSDTIHPEIKYGGGPPEMQIMLEAASNAINDTEEFERELANLHMETDDGQFTAKIAALEIRMADHKKILHDQLTRIIMWGNS